MAQVLKNGKIDIVCLQETHLNTNETKQLKQVFQGIYYHAPSRSWSMGVELGVSTYLEGTLIEAYIDLEV